MMKRTMTAKEKVVRRNIESIREHIIERQIEAEFLEKCINESQPKLLNFYDVVIGLGGFPVDENEELTDERAYAVHSYNSAKSSIEAMQNALNEHRAVEAALIAKLSFYKEKRQEILDKKAEKNKQQQEKFVEESMELLNAAPEKISVDINNVKFKKANKRKSAK